MAITVQKRPYSYCFSGNPVHYELYSALAAADNTVSIEIRVMFRSIGGSYNPTPSIPFNPVEGISTIDIQDIVDGLLEYMVPSFPGDEKTIQLAATHTGEFYLQYREITTANSNPSWDDSEVDYERFIVKGGLSHWKYQGNNFWLNYFNTLAPGTAKNPFLTWQKRKRLAAATERMYLLFLNITNATALKAVATAVYSDTSTAQISSIYAAPQSGSCYYIPAGATQWGLASAIKRLYYWEIAVFDNSDPLNPVQISEAFRYKSDNRNDYNDITLSYRASLGGLDSVRIRGIIEHDSDYTFSEQSRTTAPDYFDGPTFTPQKIIANSKEQVTYKGDIGYLDKEEQDRLRDTHLIRETWWEVGRKWWPMNIMTKSVKRKTSQDTVFSFPIEFTHAHIGDNFYTPMSVDLGQGIFTANVCLATVTIDSVNVDLSGADALVTVALTEVDPQAASTQLRWRLVGQIDWTVAAYGNIVFHCAKENAFIFEVQSICTNNIYGRKSSAQVDTHAAASGGGQGTGGTGGAQNSIIFNQTSIGTPFNLGINGQGITEGYVGANSAATLNVADYASANITFTFGLLIPSMVTLTTDSGNVYYGTINSHVVTFTNIPLIGGFALQIN